MSIVPESVDAPSTDKRPRYYLPECTSSTLSGAAMFAVGGAVYRTIPSLSAYAQDLTARAEQAFVRARVTTNNFTTFQTDCDDGDIRSGDADKPADIQLQSAVVAAVYLFEVTGKAEYKAFVDANYNQIQPMANQWWGPYLMHVHAALLRYAANPAATPTVASAIRTTTEGRMTVSPNPADGPVRVQVLTDETQPGTSILATLSVLSLSGTVVASHAVQAQPGLNEYTLDLSRQSSGTYLVQWQTATKRLVQRLVLVK